MHRLFYDLYNQNQSSLTTFKLPSSVGWSGLTTRDVHVFVKKVKDFFFSLCLTIVMLSMLRIGSRYLDSDALVFEQFNARISGSGAIRVHTRVSVERDGTPQLR